jgi:hypothetical protein
MASPTIFCDKGIGMPLVGGGEGGGGSVKMFEDHLHNFLSSLIDLFYKFLHLKKELHRRMMRLQENQEQSHFLPLKGQK